MVLYFRNMGIRKIQLFNFRNFRKKELEFSDGITVIVGSNASGKTNILEAIFFLAIGKSFKARKGEECIRYEENLARIKSHDLEVVLTKDVDGWPKKKLLINGIPKRLIDFAGNLKVTLFVPHDLGLVTETPTLRRKFLDTVLSQVDREYRRAILSYDKGLRQRNRLLYRIREEGINRNHLLFWNQLLIKNGNYITKMREEFIEFINSLEKCNLKYDYSAISEGRLEQYKNEETASATTLVGPHRDDFAFLQNGRDLASFGSRGEQRMAVLWLKIAELSYIEKTTSEMPTLLLDDIFSELDHTHRKVVIDIIGNYQTIITTADPHFVSEFKKGKIKIINL